MVAICAAPVSTYQRPVAYGSIRAGAQAAGIDLPLANPAAATLRTNSSLLIWLTGCLEHHADAAGLTERELQAQAMSSTGAARARDSFLVACRLSLTVSFGTVWRSTSPQR